MSLKNRVQLDPDVKKAIRKAQRRLREAPAFMKELAHRDGLDFGLSTKGTVSDVALAYKKAQKINEMEEMTKRGYNAWVKRLAGDTRLSVKTIEYALSQIDARQMDYIQNSKLRYGSNPQLDYLLDNTIEIAGRIDLIKEELLGSDGDWWADNFEVF